MSADQQEIFSRLDTGAAAHDVAGMVAVLAGWLRDNRRWHALFDLRLLEARLALGLPPSGELPELPAAQRDTLDERSLAACREVGWPLLDEGQIAAGWMYLRAAAAPGEVAAKLSAAAEALLAAADGDDEVTAARLHEILHVALWEGVDPALGIDLVVRTQGTCSAITTYEQAVSRLPARRQEPAAAALVRHLHGEVARSLAADLERRGVSLPPAADPPASLVPLLGTLRETAGEDDASLHVDVSHLQSVLRIGRVCTAPDVVRRGWELACYACRLPREMVYPGEPPFEDVGEASRLFFGAMLGHEPDRAIAFFRRAAAQARIQETGTLPADTLALLLVRLGRPEEALYALLERPPEGPMPSTVMASGMLPSLVDLAAASGGWEPLLAACRSRGDEITYTAALLTRMGAGPTAA
ncbi:MAG: hypothetical protein ACKOTB_10070 [Planctomycetia bacterium]